MPLTKEMRQELEELRIRAKQAALDNDSEACKKHLKEFIAKLRPTRVSDSEIQPETADIFAEMFPNDQ